MVKRLCVLALGLALAAPRTAAAFCGFYVGGGDARLYNNATLVVLMRDGTRTVLSMQNNYQGPPEDFALVVPVPVILAEKDVKTLPKSIFSRVDKLAAPRLVEYWEQDPCDPYSGYGAGLGRSAGAKAAEADMASDDGAPDLGVKIEAQFVVGEYEILILSAEEATGLDTWLRQHDYKIPAGAAEVLRPYVAAGMKFFVAKVDVKKVKFDAKGQAMLSPLRFHYDSETFNLPVRLGLLNSGGVQDLLVHILARQRYEVANYKTVPIPTNIEVKKEVKASFGEFYVALLDAVLARDPGAVITEYAWQASNCDPCPVDPLSARELRTLGADVLPRYRHRDRDDWSLPEEFVLTRLHARYAKDSLGEDLIFKSARPIVGGREGEGPGRNERGARRSDMNNFQARYIVRHRWWKKLTCEDPQRGIWGGPPDGRAPRRPVAARDLAFVPRGGEMTAYVAEKFPDLKSAAVMNVPPPVDPNAPPVDPNAPPAEAPPAAPAATNVDAASAPAATNVDAAPAKANIDAAPAPAKAAPVPVPSASPPAAGCGCRATDPPWFAVAVVPLLARRRRR
jgi:MYXO-CTERM domain-containing protein